MTEPSATIVLTRDRVTRRVSILALVLIALLAAVGPSGVLSWADNLSQLDTRKAEVAKLEAERDELRNRVALLDPKHVDPDIAGELIRSELNVVHPDDLVIVLKPGQ